MIKECLTCHKKFKTSPSRNIGYCSYECYWKSRKGKPTWNKGKKCPQISISLIGKKHSIETLKKMSIAHIGKTHTEISRQKISKGNKGKKRTYSQLGEKGHSWKGGRAKHSQGYMRIYKPEHPFSVGNYVFEHRLIMEKYLGRYLSPSEIVHHINGIVDDNRIENLMLCHNIAEHRKMHKHLN